MLNFRWGIPNIFPYRTTAFEIGKRYVHARVCWRLIMGFPLIVRS
jgi:hypothetical protein